MGNPISFVAKLEMLQGISRRRSTGGPARVRFIRGRQRYANGKHCISIDGFPPMIRALLILVLLGCLLFLGDYLSVRFQIPGHRPQFGSVVVQRYYAVPLKNRSTEYMFDQPVTESCVYSLFPHFGALPCWYLSRHTQQRIKAGGWPSGPTRLAAADTPARRPFASRIGHPCQSVCRSLPGGFDSSIIDHAPVNFPYRRSFERPHDLGRRFSLSPAA